MKQPVKTQSANEAKISAGRTLSSVNYSRYKQQQSIYCADTG